MRTDVKVGLITGVLILGGVIAYTAIPSPKKTQQIAPSQHGLQAREVTTGFGPAPASADVVVIPAPSTPTTGPSAADPFSTPAPGATRPSGFSDLGPGSGSGADPFATSTRPASHIASDPFPSHPTPHNPTPNPFDPIPTPSPNPFAETTTPAATTGGIYTIVSGDTLGKVAKANHVTLKALQTANPTADSSHLKIGQKITIPAATPSTPTTPGPATRPHATTRPGSGTSSTSTVPVGGTTYKVKAGDTLSKIAKALYGDSSQYTKILRANKDQITNEDQIKEGMTLKIPH